MVELRGDISSVCRDCLLPIWGFTSEVERLSNIERCSLSLKNRFLIKVKATKSLALHIDIYDIFLWLLGQGRTGSAGHLKPFSFEPSQSLSPPKCNFSSPSGFPLPDILGGCAKAKLSQGGFFIPYCLNIQRFLNVTSEASLILPKTFFKPLKNFTKLCNC